MSNRTMIAVRLHQYGRPAELKYETDVPVPIPGEQELLIRVHAAGVNPVDWKICDGYGKDRLRHKLPLILGWDASGVVEAVGSGVHRLKIGDAVYSRPDIARDGGYAEHMVARESEVALKPSSLDHIQAAAVPLAALTAWQSLFDAADLSAGQRVLIHAAAGGVGHFAVQLAKWKGAQVIGTASASHHSFLHEIGADEAIDYTQEQFEKTLQPVDVVFDLIGGDTQRRSWSVLKRGGTLVSIVEPPADELARRHGVHGKYVFVQPNAAQLGELAGLIDHGQVRPVVQTILPLQKVHRAHELSRASHVCGKIVLQVVS
jgi:NADPH:quinone reductase-like Zn-dependent oxidoreductase